MNVSNKQQQAWLMLAVGAITLTVTLSMSAQVQTETTTTSGPATAEVKVDRATVVLVDGNDLVVKTQGGKLVHFANVPESARATVDGQQLGIHDLKPGMTLERTITTTTTPQTITTVKSVTGTVWYVNPPSSVILTLEDGTNQAFKIPGRPEVQYRWPDGGCVGSEERDEGVSDQRSSRCRRRLLNSRSNWLSVCRHRIRPQICHLLIVVVLSAHARPGAGPPAEVASATLPRTASQLPLIGILGASLSCRGLVSERSDCEQRECGHNRRLRRWFGARYLSRAEPRRGILEQE